MLTGFTPLEIAMFLISALLAMTLHEAMHGYMAYWLGDPTAAEEGRLTLNPLKSIDIFTTVLLPLLLILAHIPPFMAAKPVPFNPHRVKYGEYGAALVSIAGPLTNLLLAILAALFFRGIGANANPNIDLFLAIFVWVNVLFFVFNMIPIPPLDGSRLLYAFAPESLQDLMRQIESAGFVAIIAIMFIVVQFLSTPLVNIESHLINFLLGGSSGLF